MKPGTLAAVIVLAGLVLGTTALLLNLQGLVPKPESYAAATGTVMAAQAQATRYKMETDATAVYLVARQAAVTRQIVSEEPNESVRAWGLTIGQIGAILSVCIVILAIAVLLWHRSHIIPRDKATGQLPAYEKKGVVVNLQAVPAFTLPTGDQPAQILGDLDSEQQLKLSIAALAPTYAAAMMRHDSPAAQGTAQSRIKVVREGAKTTPWGDVTAPAKVTFIGDGDVAENLARQAGLQLIEPKDDPGSAIQVAPDAQHNAAVAAPPPLVFDDDTE